VIIGAETVNSDRQSEPRHKQLWLVPTPGQAGRQPVATVAVKAPTLRGRSFAVPVELADAVRPGAWVRVPLGRRDRVVDGLCLAVSDQPWDSTRKPIIAVQPGPSWLSPHLVALGLWVSDYYASPPWKSFAAVVPRVARVPRGRPVRYLRRAAASPTCEPTPRQQAVLDAVGDGERRQLDVLRETRAGPRVVQTLCGRGLLECVIRRETAPDTAPLLPAPPRPCAEDDFALTPGQQAAAARVGAHLEQANAFRVFLLFGVPGSGKTEVYVRVIRAALARGRQAILLIPEIALTTQLVDRLARRLPRVAVLHSQLTPRARQTTLSAIAAGDVDVVLGTRSAVFAPCPRLGVLVVDEEQEPSFKNLAAPYYHARDVAIKRGQLEDVPVVLGTATPALETWFNAQERNHFELLRLPERVPGAQLPQVRHVELRENELDEAPLLSPELRRALDATLGAGHQAILLHNRRGYAPFLRCEKCGLLLRCERCGCHLVYHRTDEALKCHRCGGARPVPPSCVDDTCRGKLRRAGSAIQRLEAELRASHPTARLLRLDRDTMRRRDDYRQALDRFEAGDADILLGTQMVAKGLDFPRVRLVGVIEADAALRLPDFRAGERVFQLVVQVIGRAGRRDGESLAIVQSTGRAADLMDPALRLDYEQFATRELRDRRRLTLPPAARLARLVLADPRPHRAQQEAERLAERLVTRAATLHAGLRVEPASRCVVGHLRGRLRYQVLVRGPRDAGLTPLLAATLEEKDFRPRVERFTIDVDPQELL
jgi:primosomal protein N' (replication factor Y)